MSEVRDVIVIGAGLTGLAAARVLEKNSVNFLVLEKAPEVGGRVSSEVFEGCVLDRGFQVVLPAYPSIKSLNLPIEFMPFSRAATCISSEGRSIVADPLHHPGLYIRNFARSQSSIPDLFRLLKHIESRHFELSTDRLIDVLGYSEFFKNNFLQPFLKGVLLDPNLASPSPLSSYFLERFFLGGAALFHGGIRALPKALAKNLEINLNCEVSKTSENEVFTADRKRFSAKIIVDTRPEIIGRETTWLETHCHYFLVSKPVHLDRRIVLCNADLRASINHIANLTEVDPSYSPAGTALLSVTTRGGENFTLRQVRNDLTSILGLPEGHINHLKTFHIKHALPLMRHLPETFPESPMPRREGNTLFASDTLAYGSQQAALRMGELAGNMAANAIRTAEPSAPIDRHRR